MEKEVMGLKTKIQEKAKELRHYFNVKFDRDTNWGTKLVRLDEVLGLVEDAKQQIQLLPRYHAILEMNKELVELDKVLAVLDGDDKTK